MNKITIEVMTQAVAYGCKKMLPSEFGTVKNMLKWV